MLRTVSIAVALLVGAVTANAADKPRDASQVKQWIADLDDDNFTVRDAATAKLINAGDIGTTESLVRTAESGSPEARSRAILVLRNWFKSSDSKVRKVAQATATKWQKAKDPQIVWLGRAVVAKPVAFVPPMPQWLPLLV